MSARSRSSSSVGSAMIEMTQGWHGGFRRGVVMVISEWECARSFEKPLRKRQVCWNLSVARQRHRHGEEVVNHSQAVASSRHGSTVFVCTMGHAGIATENCP